MSINTTEATVSGQSETTNAGRAANAEAALSATPTAPVVAALSGNDQQREHTPGPWCIGNGGHAHGAEWEVRSADDADWYITGVPWGDDTFDPGIPRPKQAYANARLISVAPEMLAMLKGMLPKNVCITNPRWADSEVVPIDVTLGELRAVAALIAKATGGRA